MAHMADLCSPGRRPNFAEPSPFGAVALASLTKKIDLRPSSPRSPSPNKTQHGNVLHPRPALPPPYHIKTRFYGPSDGSPPALHLAPLYNISAHWSGITSRCRCREQPPPWSLLSQHKPPESNRLDPSHLILAVALLFSSAVAETVSPGGRRPPLPT